MGCSFVKMHGNARNGDDDLEAKAGNSMACGRSDLPAPPAPAPTDPRLPLTAQQRFKISKSWKGIARAMDYTGVNMFIKLFQEHEELLDLFEKFRDMRTREEQSESLELQQHAAIVMTTLDEGITALDNVDFFFDFLHKVGRTHRRIPGFHKEYFWKIQRPFLEAVKETLEDRYTENMETIYTITIQFILETLVKGYELEDGTEATEDLQPDAMTPDGQDGVVETSNV